MKKMLLAAALLATAAAAGAQTLHRQLFNDGWSFTKDGQTRTVKLPHDWGVEGPFRQEYPGETGKLAWWGKAWYAKTLEIAFSKDVKRGDVPLVCSLGVPFYSFC